MNILFLGAAKRLSLLEFFQKAAVELNVPLNLFSVEQTKYCPIGTVAEVIECQLPFKSEEFESFLLETAQKLHIDLCIPLMDAATVTLSKLAVLLQQVGCHAVVSDYELCRVMEDKELADIWFEQHNIPVPSFRNSPNYPYIAKSRTGFGSRDQFIIRDETDFVWFWAKHEPRDYFLQPFVQGQEFTVDCYVSMAGKIISMVSRKRLLVEVGESMTTVTHKHQGILELCEKVLSVPGFRGPITLQAISASDGPLMIECNPRHGGACTLSIACGQDSPRWILQEAMGMAPDPVPEWKDGVLLTRCRRDVVWNAEQNMREQ